MGQHEELFVPQGLYLSAERGAEQMRDEGSKQRPRVGLRLPY